ncbi:hypothetical protein TREMEDRAFT_27765 [Tremella mesenterica DSM 1558]|uniref:uncharacterized protein n=1 Tax=Tremella mesenterica (strain ATCC 24925 / CBS 8224 / DSM 1558 / NBRC 9311 / NRRL Y-6157 / RJB 2259-6 / UBC 559-6) TaxID=578456 RepID=UPI0003F4A63B|nr:uncharacterized protein TREMEDRAFT_27765 [Tremella mesenterica DSM 1558]EIW71607.1 hypothetical protein TREMEDRAFT_27765 [Tremella mesenterica DSM 1558]
MRRNRSRRPSEAALQVYAENVNKYGKKTAKKISEGKLAIENGKKYDMSLWKSIYLTLWPKWWMAVALNGAGGALRICAPLITRLLIEQLILAHAYHLASVSGQSTADLERPKSLGYGIGLAFIMFLMQIVSAGFLYVEMQAALSMGCTTRAAMVDVISRKSMRLSPKARLEMTNGRITQMVTADASYLDWVLPATVDLPVQPVIILVGIGLLIYTLGYSALVGLGVLFIAAPSQGFMFKKLLSYRKSQEKLVDSRVRLLTETINNIRAVKLYAYEKLFLDKVSAIRKREHARLKKFGFVRSAVWATFDLAPVLAAVLTFITYGATGHSLNPAIIFSGLQMFSVLKQPISQLPMILSSVMDALVALGRISQLLKSEDLPHDLHIDPHAKYSIEVVGDFQFETSKAKKSKWPFSRNTTPEPDEKEEEQEQIPFSLIGMDLKVPQGALVCVVGRVGTGKTALLLSMLNEMRQKRGHVKFGGPVGYVVPQHAWVQSGTIRDNITFASKPEDVCPDRVNSVIDACCLRPDVEMWADGDQTQIGEKGITLSGGQRQRVCIARAAYDTGSIVLLDDPLSAVDAQVGLHLLHNCILNGPLADRTRILVTHHLDVLPHADLILVMDRAENNVGRVVQQGTYTELCATPGIFRTLIDEFGSANHKSEHPQTEDQVQDKDDSQNKDKSNNEQNDSNKAPGGTAKFMLDEERQIGSVGWAVYRDYLRATGSWLWPVLAGFLLLGEQGALVSTTLVLGFWSEQIFTGWTEGDYMALYAAVGCSVAFFTWSTGFTMILGGISASYHMFNQAWYSVMRSPTSWHDRTPVSTALFINDDLLNTRLAESPAAYIQMLDDRMAPLWYNFLSSALSVVGTFALIIYTYPYLGLAFIPLLFFFYLCASYYRKTSRELKRLDSLLRSHVYSAVGEQLAGLTVIRAFGQQTNFQHRLQSSIDGQNRAYILSITLQRWLAVRLVVCSQGLVLLIAIFGVAFRNTVNASKFGVVLTYAASTASILNSLVPLFATCEGEMFAHQQNNVERVQHYMRLETEADPVLPTDPSPEDPWPSMGKVEFKDVQLRYRPDLPLVLKHTNFIIKAGERVGIIGRTGAGKSSIAQALFRTVELCGGLIEIDGKDCKQLGLETLRTRLAIIPQDAFLFEGTVRQNIDPSVGTKTDNALNQVLDLIHSNPRCSASLSEKFQLDVQVQNEGANFSAGERQLLALLRALVRGCKILLLDEATSSMDPETDALIQTIIQTEFSDITLISIAHRLQTVAYYDRILVMDAGQVAEYDTPLALFDEPGSVFRSLCEKKVRDHHHLLWLTS